MDRRHLEERGIYSYNYNKLKKTNMVLAKKNQESLKIAEYPLHQLICPGHLVIYIALSNRSGLLGCHH